MSIPKIMLMSVTAGCGKTLLASGLCRLLSRSGVTVAPFKAVCVARMEDLETIASTQTSRHVVGVMHQAAAAGQPFSYSMNPVLVFPSDTQSGRMYVEETLVGDVVIRNHDTVILDTLEDVTRSHLVSTIVRAYDALGCSFDSIVIEGAGSPVAQPPENDYPNILVARLPVDHIVLVCKPNVDGGVPSLIGTFMCLPEDVRAKVAGFVFNDVDEAIDVVSLAALAERHIERPWLGSMPHLSLDAEWEQLMTKKSSGVMDMLYDRYAEAIARHLELPSLLGIRH